MNACDWINFDFFFFFWGGGGSRGRHTQREREEKRRKMEWERGREVRGRGGESAVFSRRCSQRWLRTDLKLMYFVRTIFSLRKWCHKLYPADLAGGSPKAFNTAGWFTAAAGTSFGDIWALRRFREKKAASWGSFPPPGPTVLLSGVPGSHRPGERLLFHLFCCFSLLFYSLILSPAYLILKPLQSCHFFIFLFRL